MLRCNIIDLIHQELSNINLRRELHIDSNSGKRIVHQVTGMYKGQRGQEIVDNSTYVQRAGGRGLSVAGVASSQVSAQSTTRVVQCADRTVFVSVVISFY